MPFDHRGRVAVVTGARQGIGRAIAAELAADGAQLVLVDLQDCDETVALVGGGAISVRADVSKEADWQVVADAAASLGGVDIMVNNAGIYPMAVIDEVDTELWRQTMAINLDAHFYSAKQFIPGMRAKKWGRFVNVSSNSIGVAGAGLAHYMASKMGVIGLVRGLANDLADSNITANAILPSFTRTPGTSIAPEELAAMVANLQAIKRNAVPEDVVGTVSFLASDKAAFITGQAISVDGGLYKIS